MIDPRLTKICSHDDFIIYLVDAYIVRSSEDENDAVDFALGGHSFRYDFIPQNEIWIEPVMNKEDQEFNTAHEIIERFLQKSFNIPYNAAHTKAARAERIMRRVHIKDPIRCAFQLCDTLAKRRLFRK